MGWLRTNELKLSCDNMEVLLVGSSSGLRSGCPLILYGIAITPKASVYSWGVILDLGLLLDNQMMAIAKCTYHQFRLVHQLLPFLDKKDLTLSHSWLQAQLQQCALCGTALEDYTKVQIVQNAAAHLLMGMNIFYHMTPLLKELHWPTFISYFKVLLTSYKALYSLGPGHLKDNLIFPYIFLDDHYSHLRSAFSQLLTNRGLFECDQEEVFLNCSPWLPNVLPPQDYLATTLIHFR